MRPNYYTSSGFTCGRCGALVSRKAIGTAYRNHCPFCLWSQHVDLKKPGDRLADCGGMMAPVGLTFKKDREGRTGELMLVHQCLKCGRITKNRIAGDDQEEKLAEVFEVTKDKKEMGGIELLKEDDRHQLMTQLFGKPR